MKEIKDLPTELLIKIFSQLNPYQLAAIVAQVCKEWQRLSADNSLWKDFINLPRMIGEERKISCSNPSQQSSTREPGFYKLIYIKNPSLRATFFLNYDSRGIEHRNELNEIAQRIIKCLNENWSPKTEKEKEILRSTLAILTSLPVLSAIKNGTLPYDKICHYIEIARIQHNFEDLCKFIMAITRTSILDSIEEGKLSLVRLFNLYDCFRGDLLADVINNFNDNNREQLLTITEASGPSAAIEATKASPTRARI